MSEAQTYITLKAAARALNVHEQTIRNWERRGLIRLARLPGSRHRRVPVTEVARLQAQMRLPGPDTGATARPRLPAQAVPGDGVRIVRPSGDEAQVAAGRALAETIRRELADLETTTTLEQVMSALRGRAWSS